MKTETEHEVKKEEQKEETPTGKAHRERTATVSEVRDERQGLWTAQGIVKYIFGLIEILLVFRFFLLLLGANPANAFVGFIYGITGIFVAPFVDIFGDPGYPGTGENVFEPASLVAIAVYAFLAWVINRLLEIIVTNKSA